MRNSHALTARARVDPQRPSDDVGNAMREAEALFAALLALSHASIAAVEAEDAVHLLALLDERDALIPQLEAAVRELARIRSASPAFERICAPVEQTAREAELLASQLRERAAARLSEISDELGRLDREEATNAAYRKSDSQAARRIDVRR